MSQNFSKLNLHCYHQIINLLRLLLFEAAADFYFADVPATVAVALAIFAVVDFVAVVDSFVTVADDDVPYLLNRHPMTVL